MGSIGNLLAMQRSVASLHRLWLSCLAIALLLFAFPAQASTCQQWQGHTICFVQIKRSAKYSWEYRAQVTIDGVKQPPTVYNCRTRQATPKSAAPQPFTEDGAGALICKLVNR